MSSSIATKDTNRVSFVFTGVSHVNKAKKPEYGVYKADEKGRKRRYVEGVVSGNSVDGHGEIVTPNCIQSFMKQANSGDILLYADEHGIRATQDIGILVSCKVLQNGDWFVTFRLYDEFDDVGQWNKDTADMTWKQLLGLPPYKHAKQRGFSVEGAVPDGGIKEMLDDERRVMDDIILDGVVLVPCPAYKASIASAVSKALIKKEDGALSSTNGGDSLIRQKLVGDEKITSDYLRKSKIQDAFDDSLEEIKMEDCDDITKAQKIDKLFNEYKELIVPELQQINKSLFNNKLVEKGSMLSPEETALVNNIKSILDQLGQIKAGKDAVDQHGGNNGETNNGDANMAEEDVTMEELTGNPPTDDPNGSNDAVELSDEELMQAMEEPDGDEPVSMTDDELMKALKEELGEEPDGDEVNMADEDLTEDEITKALMIAKSLKIRKSRVRKGELENPSLDNQDDLIPDGSSTPEPVEMSDEELEKALKEDDIEDEVSMALAKSLASMSRRTNVQKSYDVRPQVNGMNSQVQKALVGSITKLANAVSTQAHELNTVKKSLGFILDGMGITDVISKEYSGGRSTPSFTTGGDSTIENLSLVKKSLKTLQKEGAQVAGNSGVVRKDLGSAMNHIFGANTKSGRV